MLDFLGKLPALQGAVRRGKEGWTAGQKPCLGGDHLTEPEGGPRPAEPSRETTALLTTQPQPQEPS